MARKKTPKQLDREIASSLRASGQPALADLFASPVFAREMRHELQTRRTSAVHAAALAERPFTVKKTGEGLVGNYKTEADAIEKARTIGGWVEERASGKIIWGSR